MLQGIAVVVEHGDVAARLAPHEIGDVQLALMFWMYGAKPAGTAGSLKAPDTDIGSKVLLKTLIFAVRGHRRHKGWRRRRSIPCRSHGRWR